MDKDVVIGWEHRYREGELSAIQHAYNLLIDRGQLVFDCEYQNEQGRKAFERARHFLRGQMLRFRGASQILGRFPV